MRMNDTMLGYLSSGEAVRRQAENPYLYLNQMAGIAKTSSLYAHMREVVPEVKNAESTNLLKNSINKEKISIKKASAENNNRPDGILFYNSTGVKVSSLQNQSFEYFA